MQSCELKLAFNNVQLAPRHTASSREGEAREEVKEVGKAWEGEGKEGGGREVGRSAPAVP